MAADAKPSCCGESGPGRPEEPPRRPVKLDAAAYRMLAALERASSQHGALRALTHRARAEMEANPALAHLPLEQILSAAARDDPWSPADPAAAAAGDAAEKPHRAAAKGPELILEGRRDENR